MSEYQIYSVNGPVVKVSGGRGLAMMDMVYTGEEQLIGEVVGVEGELTTVQVYEDTTGLSPGQPVCSTGAPMSLLLGPGLLGNIFDGIGRPLRALEAASGPFLGRGINIPALDSGKTWDVTIPVKEGDTVKKGQVLGIIEAMKLMNEIESEYDGVVEAVLVGNEEVVEYGQPLFRIR